MKELIDVFSNNQILILGIVLFIFGLILLGYLLTVIITNKKKKNKAYAEMKEIANENKKIVEEIHEKNQEDIQKEEKIANELEEMLDKMQKTLDEKEELDNIANFEREQEENAIISYQELLKAAKKDFPQMNLDDSKPEIIEVKEEKLERIEVPIEVVSKEESEIVEVNDDKKIEEKKFKSSIFISPIGVTDNDNQNYYKEVRIRRDYLKEMADSRFNTVDIQTNDLDFEEVQNEQFLEDLKNFRNNL